MKDEATEAGKQKARLNIPAGTLAIIPLRNRVLFPSMMMPLSVNRPARRQIVEEAVRQQIPIGFVTLKDSTVENPAPSELFKCSFKGGVVLRSPNSSRPSRR
jgi:ATP-dependent Lon protease